MAKKANDRVQSKAPKRSQRPRLFDWRTFDPAMIPDDGAPSFVKELTTYRDRLPELLEHEGEYVVIKGHEIIGFYPERVRALYEAASRFGNEPVLVKQVVAKEPVGTIGHVLP